MIFGSVCSGIEAASVAWCEPLGWTAAFVAEIDPFCCALLKEHYPEVPNIGDFTKADPARLPAIDLLVGGTPCQDFSIAGARSGVAGTRGNLTLEFLRLAGELRPEWLVWENVPGVLSIDHGRTFDAILGTLAKLGYGFAYRILDAQFVGGCPLHVDEFGIGPVPQRRRRVFVVARLGDWRSPAQVLFEPESLRGYPAPSGAENKEVAGSLGSSATGGFGFDLDRGSFIPDVAYGLNARPSRRYDAQANETFIAHSLRADGFDASEDGTGSGTPLVAVPLTPWLRQGLRIQDANGIADALTTNQAGGTQINPVLAPVAGSFQETGPGWWNETPTAATLRTPNGSGSLQANLITPPICFSAKDNGRDATDDLAPTMRSMNHVDGNPDGGGQLAVAVNLRGRDGGGTAELGTEIQSSLRTGGGGADKPHVLTTSAVRRLTPRECEALMNLPPDYTLIRAYQKAHALDLADYYHRTERGRLVTEVRKGKLYATPDGPRYRAIGNSFAVSVARWLGRRIQEVAT